MAANLLVRNDQQSGVELTYIDGAPSAASAAATAEQRRRSDVSGMIGGSLLALLGCVGLLMVVLVQLRLDHFPYEQHLLVVDVKNDDVVEGALIRRSNPPMRPATTSQSSKDSHLVDVCGRRGGNVAKMAEECVAKLMASLPKRGQASLVVVVTGREVLRHWIGCNVTLETQRIGEIATAIAKQYPPSRLKVADPLVRLVNPQDQAVGAFVGSNRQHLETVGVIGVDSKSAFVSFHYDEPPPPVVVTTTTIEPSSNSSNTTISMTLDEQLMMVGTKTLFQEDFYCFGLDEVWRIYLSTLLGNNRKQRTAKDPCAPANAMYSLAWDEIWRTACSEAVLRSQSSRPGQCSEDEQNYRQVARVDLTGSGNPAECRNRLGAIFKTAQGANNKYSGRTIPQDLRGEFIFFDLTGAVARAFELAFRDREGPAVEKDETVLSGRHLYLQEVSTAVHDLCSKSLDPKQIRASFAINTTRQENDGWGPNSDNALRRVCFDAFYGVELLASLGIVRSSKKSSNHVVLARPPAAGVDVARPVQVHESDQAGHWTADWLIGFLETSEAPIAGDLRRIRPLGQAAFAILLVFLAASDLIGLVLVIVFALRFSRRRSHHRRLQLQVS